MPPKKESTTKPPESITSAKPPHQDIANWGNSDVPYLMLTPEELALLEKVEPNKPTPTTESKTPSSESLSQSFDPFITETMKKWYGSNKNTDIPPSLELVRPQDIDYDIKKDDIDQSKTNQYTLNPDTQDIDFSTLNPDKIKVIELPNTFNGKPLSEVAKYVIATYSVTHHLPGLEYYKYIFEHPDQAPPSLKDGKYHFFFGSLLRSADGHWDVPYVWWDGMEFRRRANWLSFDWGGAYRLVLFEN